jgi:hypothetical protein
MRVNNTEARRQASRENGKKGRGPVTEEGRRASSRNALKHGLTAETLVAPEDMDALRERVEAWAEAAGPGDTIEGWLVERAAWASVRLDRVARREMAEIARRRRAAAEAFDSLQERRASESLGILASFPAQAVRLLTGCAPGRERLRALWSSWADRVEAGAEVDRASEDEALRLLGHDPARGRDPEPGTPAAELLALSEALPDSRPALAAFARARAEDLDALGRLLAAEEEDARALAINRALLDDSPAGHLQRRYETAVTSDLHRALLELRRHQDRRLAGSEPEGDPPFAAPFFCRPEAVRNEPDAPELVDSIELGNDDPAPKSAAGPAPTPEPADAPMPPAVEPPAPAGPTPAPGAGPEADPGPAPLRNEPDAPQAAIATGFTIAPPAPPPTPGPAGPGHLDPPGTNSGAAASNSVTLPGSPGSTLVDR